MLHQGRNGCGERVGVYHLHDGDLSRERQELLGIEGLSMALRITSHRCISPSETLGACEETPRAVLD
jgi:hypothetical protein